jgi:glucose-1-phosphate cytidylyltransferase
MKVVILAGGYGTRMAEQTVVKPKPLVSIGGRPILWHIMRLFLHHGHRDFIICLGYKGYLIKEYFANYLVHNSDLTFDFTGDHEQVIVHERVVEPWRVTLVDTGLDTQTGGRIRRIQSYTDGEPFFMTYGDGVADIDLGALVTFHEEHGRMATVTGVLPPGRFGAIDADAAGAVSRFSEKLNSTDSWINGGFFVLNPDVFRHLDDYGDDMPWEYRPLQRITADSELMVYRHRGFWQCMDTMRDVRTLARQWESGKAPWKVWD